MRGIGTTSGAVTVVNALPTGIGCALAISLPVRVEIELRSAEGSGNQRIQIERSADTELVRETLSVGLARFAPGEKFSGEVRVDSQVPVGKGLKSSSAVGGAILRAIGGALRQSRPPDELARLAADVAQQIGLSATGAYDDCLAALQGGLVLTDNTKRTSLRAPPLTGDLRAVLWIPPEPHRPSTVWLERFRAEAASGRVAVEAARRGDWREAMTRNTELVERVMGYDYGGLRSELLQAGSAMCGVSGMGPALAALVPRANVDAVAARLPPDRGQILLADIRPGDDWSEGIE
jgi:shikimate kinase